MNPREIAEKIIKKDLVLDNVHSDYIILACAYSELEKKTSILKQDLDSEKRNHKIFREAAEGYLKKLKKSREVLRKACEFYGNRVNSPDGIIHKSDCETIFVHEPLEKDKNGIVVAGKKAREALKADDEVMVVGK